MFDAVIVGGGPRAVATVLRLVARRDEATGHPWRVTIVDAVDVGAGATWRIDQPAGFLNNTTSGATTIHADDSTPMTGPVVPGPDLVTWSRDVVAADSHELDWVLAEARQITPGSFPSRRIQGVYFREQLAHAEAAGIVELTRMRSTVVDIAPALDHEAHRTVVLADGRKLLARTVVLAQGMVQSRLTGEEEAFAAAAERDPRLVYMPPGMPAERDWSAVPGGETVIARGLGANFFDIASQLSTGRGGRFEAVAGDPSGRLRYLPSGDEPLLVAGSGRGVPYRSKPDGELPVPPFRPRHATPEWFHELHERAPGSVDFLTEVWPTIARELAWAHVEALTARRPEALRVAPAAATAALDAARTVEDIDAALSRIHEPDDAAGFDFRIDHLRRPTGGARVDPQRWHRLVRHWVEHELGSMTQPRAHPRSAVNLAMAALRGPVAQLDRLGVLEAGSAERDLSGWFTSDGLFLASGPPAGRTREVLALIEAGIIRLLGPQLRVGLAADGTGFTASSAITGEEVSARALIEPRMSKGKVPTTDDPLIRSLLGRGAARIHERITAAGTPIATESLESTEAGMDADAVLGHNLVAADGRIDPAVIVLGIPSESTQRGSAIGAIPGVPSPLLAGADVAARQIIARGRSLRGARATRIASASD